MEEFQNQNWLWKTCRSTTSSLYAKNFSDDERDIFFCHLNEIDHMHLLDDYGKDSSDGKNVNVGKDPRTGEEVTNELHDHSTSPKMCLFPNFPKQSSMNSKQHQSCLNAIEKLKDETNNVSMSDREDIRCYAQLAILRSKEKAEFLEFVKDEFYRRNIRNCYDLRPELNKFIIKRWKDSIKRAVTSNNNYYQLQTAIPIANGSINDEITIEYENTINQTGVVLAINSKKYSNPIQPSCSYLDIFFSNDAGITIPPDEISHSVDVVISLTTLKTILTSAKELSTQWNIIFNLKECDNRKVIIFHHSLPVPSLACLEKNRQAYKYGITAEIVIAKKGKVFCYDENRFIERIHEYIEYIDAGLTSNQQQEEIPNYKVWGFEDYLNKFTNSSSEQDRTADSNIIRRLWNVRRNNAQYCRLVIDNRQDYCEEKPDGIVEFINLSPKIEYQSEFGAEQMTYSELISEWCDLRFGPNTKTHRVRIDAKSASVMEKKEVTISDVEHDLRRLYQVKIESLLDPFFVLMETVKQFPPNEYLLRHLEKHNSQAMVYAKSNEMSSANAIRIADIYESSDVDTSNIETIPWNPIDDTVCTVIHKRSSVMPCAFPNWGKKRGAKSNDRINLVKKAVKKENEKLATIQAKQKIINKRKALKKQRTKQRKKEETKVKNQLLAKLSASALEGESLDPNELFDEEGNIHFSSFVSRNVSEQNIQPNTENNSSDTMCFATYCRDADVLSDDLVDS